MEKKATIFITVGYLFLVFVGFGLLNSSYNSSKGFGFLHGQMLFDIVMAIIGIVLIAIGVSLERKNK